MSATLHEPNRQHLGRANLLLMCSCAYCHTLLHGWEAEGMEEEKRSLISGGLPHTLRAGMAEFLTKNPFLFLNVTKLQSCFKA